MKRKVSWRDPRKQRVTLFIQELICDEAHYVFLFFFISQMVCHNNNVPCLTWSLAGMNSLESFDRSHQVLQLEYRGQVRSTNNLGGHLGVIQ